MIVGICALFLVSLMEIGSCTDVITDAALLELSHISRGLRTKLDIKKVEPTNLPVGKCKYENKNYNMYLLQYFFSYIHVLFICMECMLIADANILIVNQKQAQVFVNLFFHFQLEP